MVAVAGGAFGLTRGGDDSTVEPTAPYQYGQELDVKDAVAATSVRGFRVLPWTQPSVQHLGGGSTSLPTYAGVDASGRLIVEPYRDAGHRGARHGSAVRRPGQPGAALEPPPSEGTSGEVDAEFTGDGRLLWTSTRLQGAPEGVNTIHVTDLAGGRDVSIPVGSVNDGVRAWVTGDPRGTRGDVVTSPGHRDPSALRPCPSPGIATARLVARDVLAADVSDGVAAWVTTRRTGPRRERRRLRCPGGPRPAGPGVRPHPSIGR